MRSRLRLAGLLVLSVSSPLGWVRGARAESPVQVVTLPPILVGISAEKIAWQRTLDEHLEHGIRRAGRTPRMPGPLSGAEMSCRDAECMARVAEGNGAGIVLGVKVIADRGTPPSYKIVLTRFDHDRPGTVRQEEADCSVCTQAETGDRLEQMVAAMLPSLVVAHPRVHEDPPTIATTPAVAAVPAVPVGAPRTVPKKLLYAAMGVSAACGVAGIAMLGAGGRALAIDGDPSSSVVSPATQAPAVYDTRSAGLGLTIAGSVLVVSAAVELGVEVWLLRKRAR